MEKLTYSQIVKTSHEDRISIKGVNEHGVIFLIQEMGTTEDQELLFRFSYGDENKEKIGYKKYKTRIGFLKTYQKETNLIKE
jgi:hypothetical protein